MLTDAMREVAKLARIFLADEMFCREVAHFNGGTKRYSQPNLINYT